MKRSSFLKRGVTAGVALTAAGSLVTPAAAKTVEWNRPIVRVHPDGRHKVIWWPGKDDSDRALQQEIDST